MRRSVMNRGSGFRRPERERTRTVHTPIAPEHRRGVIARATDAVAAQVKTEPQRNRALLAMARNRPCLLQVPNVHREDRETTVAAHSNQSAHGKAGARKADDHYSVWGCFHCHTWLDQRGAPAEEKTAVFAAALARQLEHWRAVAADPTEPARLRRAARWAIDRHEGAKS